MNFPDINEIPLALIEVGNDRARDIEPAWAEALAALIDTQGLLQPIIVRPVEGAFRKYRLVAGLHRVEAFRLLGREAIPAFLSAAASDDEARLEEVMENLGRYELIALDRCRHLFELKQVWERQSQRTLVEVLTEEGGKSFPTSDEVPEAFGFARSVAERIGLSKRAINLAVKIWSSLYPPLRRRLQGSGLATKQTELKALSELPINTQVKVVDLILGEDHPEIDNVASALLFIEGGIKPTGDEKLFRTIHTGFAKLPEETLDRLVGEFADRVIASLKRQGRI